MLGIKNAKIKDRGTAEVKAIERHIGGASELKSIKREESGDRKDSAEGKKLNVIAGVAGAAAPLIGLGSAIAAAELTKNFSWTNNVISDMLGTKYGLILSSGLVASGALTSVFAYGVYKRSRTALGKAGAAVIAAGGACLSMVGVTYGSLAWLHPYVSRGYFLMLPAGILLAGIREIKSEKERILGVGSTAISVLSGLAIFGYKLTGMAFSAVFEMSEAALVGSWVAVAGASMAISAIKARARRNRTNNVD